MAALGKGGGVWTEDREGALRSSVARSSSSTYVAARPPEPRNRAPLTCAPQALDLPQVVLDWAFGGHFVEWGWASHPPPQ